MADEVQVNGRALLIPLNATTIKVIVGAFVAVAMASVTITVFVGNIRSDVSSAIGMAKQSLVNQDTMMVHFTVVKRDVDTLKGLGRYVDTIRALRETVDAIQRPPAVRRGRPSNERTP